MQQQKGDNECDNSVEETRDEDLAEWKPPVDSFSLHMNIKVV